LAHAISVPSTRRTCPSAASSATIICAVVICGVSRLSLRLYWDWPGSSGKNPGSNRPITPKNWRSEQIPVTAWATAKAISS
jgi:hypothetical protein